MARILGVPKRGVAKTLRDARVLLLQKLIRRVN
ncbi:hypothetical protein J2T17_006458 [Paenibacillus mucilaginosus]